MADGQMREAEDARSLQERLSRERLAARRRAANTPNLVEDVKLPEEDDLITLRVTILA